MLFIHAHHQGRLGFLLLKSIDNLNAEANSYLQCNALYFLHYSSPRELTLVQGCHQLLLISSQPALSFCSTHYSSSKLRGYISIKDVMDSQSQGQKPSTGLRVCAFKNRLYFIIDCYRRNFETASSGGQRNQSVSRRLEKRYKLQMT